MRSFRPLVIFWISLFLALGIGAGILQLLGPVRHGQPGGAPPIAAKGGGAEKAVLASGENGARTVSTPGPRAELPASTGNTGKAAEAGAAAGMAIPEPDPGLQEPAVHLPDRMLPRVADDGRSPSTVYAAPFDPQEKHPRVAMVIDGIGLDQALSAQVLKTLPRTVDIAISAYAPAAVAEGLARAARRQGRECLVSIPMEPAGFPSVEEGDKALLTGNSPDQNRLNLEWVLSGVQGCVGATNASDGMLGARYAESRQGFTDLLSVLDHRGLIFLDARPGAPPLDDTSGIRTPPRVADVIVDAAPTLDTPATADAIDRNLATLNRLAAEHGSAIGVAGPPTPVLLERLAVWANALPALHLALAPVSAMPVPKPASQDAMP